MSSTRYTPTIEGHAVELEFNRDLIVVNRVRLSVDGVEIAHSSIFYGERELSATASDGVKVHVSVGSGMVGEPQRPQLQRSDGSWQDMDPVRG